MKLIDRIIQTLTPRTDGAPAATILGWFPDEPETTVRMALSRGVNAGRLERVERGVYKVAAGHELQGDVSDANLAARAMHPAGADLAVDGDLAVDAADRVPVEGVIAMEGVATGDGRMIEAGALDWDGVLPIALIWDRDDGDHSGATVGAIETIERRDGGEIWGVGYLSASDDEGTAAAVGRVRELLDEGAVGVSIRFDSQDVEVRVKKELVEQVEAEGEQAVEETEDGRVVVHKMAADDVLEVTTSGRIRHLAIVDTAAFAEASIAVAASGSLSKPDWSGRESWFADPKFGLPGSDDRLRYDPGRGAWSAPVTVTPEGRVFGHVAPMGICLRGRPDKCVTPPDANLEAFMRGHAPAAGDGVRTGVICVGGGHAQVGVGAAEATQFYDDTGRAVADVRVGRDAYGVWFAGMIRPGAAEDDVYAFKASDVSGHWEPNRQGRMELCGLPAVNVGGFPKGYLTYEEVSQGLVAAGSVAADPKPVSNDQIEAGTIDTSTIRNGSISLDPAKYKNESINAEQGCGGSCGCGGTCSGETESTATADPTSYMTVKLGMESDAVTTLVDVLEQVLTKVDSLSKPIGKLYAAHILTELGDDPDETESVDNDAVT